MGCLGPLDSPRAKKGAICSCIEHPHTPCENRIPTGKGERAEQLCAAISAHLCLSCRGSIFARGICLRSLHSQDITLTSRAVTSGPHGPWCFRSWSVFPIRRGIAWQTCSDFIVSSFFHLFNLASAQVWMRQNDTQHSKLHRCKRLHRCNEVASMQPLNHRTFGLISDFIL